MLGMFSKLVLCFYQGFSFAWTILDSHLHLSLFDFVFLLLARQSSNKFDPALASFVGFIEFTLRKALEEIAAGVF